MKSVRSFFMSGQHSSILGVIHRDKCSQGSNGMEKDSLVQTSSTSALSGSTSKAGGVRFPDDDEPPGSPTRKDNESNLSTLIAIPEKDGSYLVKAGFLKSHHCYEIVFTIPDVPTLGKELSCLPSSSPTRRFPSLRVNRIDSIVERGVKVTCEYRTHQEGVLQEEITLVTRGRKGSSLKVRFQARVIDPQHGTPMLLEGVRCLSARKDAHTKHSSVCEKI